MGYYDTAQICLNGHVITDSYNGNKELRKNFCSICGAKTITQCDNCNSPILGDYKVDGIAYVGVGTPSAPSYCHNCGAPYPWTKAKLDGLKELLELEYELTSENKEYLNKNLDAILTDTPKTQVIATKLKMLMSSKFSQVINDLLIDIASETAKKVFFPNNP